MTGTVDGVEVTGSPWDVGINDNDGQWYFRDYDMPVTETRCPSEEQAQAFCQAPCDTYCTTNAFTENTGTEVFATGSTVSSCDSEAAGVNDYLSDTIAKATAFFEGARDTLSAKDPYAPAVCYGARPRYNPHRPQWSARSERCGL
jgi:hypothetical protein